MDLDREGVTKGSVAYFRKTERVDLRMTLFGNGSEMQEAVSFLGNPVQ